MFAFAQKPDGLVVARIHHQMKSAQPLDRHNFSFTNRGGGRQKCVVAALGRVRPISRFGKVGGVLPNAATPQFQMRSADGAGVGLRVKAAVARVVVFGLALRTHCERFHRGVRAVVRQGFDDAEAGPAIRAVGERIAVATIGRIENLAQAIGTGGNVRQNERGFIAAGFTLADFKTGVTDGIEPGGFEALNETARGFFRFEAEQEFFEHCARAFNFDKNALC